MNFKDQRPSKNFKDNTNLINRHDYQYNPAVEDLWRRIRMGDAEDTSLSHFTNPGSPPSLSYGNLSEDEKTLVQDYNFSPQDILLLRTFKVSPGQVMQGWNLQR